MEIARGGTVTTGFHSLNPSVVVKTTGAETVDQTIWHAACKVKGETTSEYVLQLLLRFSQMVLD